MLAGRRVRSRVRSRVAGVTAAVLALGVVPVVAAPVASAAPTELFFSEYVEGSSSNKALEIYNGTGAPVDLAAAGYAVRLYFNGSPSSSGTNVGCRESGITGCAM